MGATRLASRSITRRNAVLAAAGTIIYSANIPKVFGWVPVNIASQPHGKARL